MNTATGTAAGHSRAAGLVRGRAQAAQAGLGPDDLAEGRSRTVVLLGIDGVGKTTTAEVLAGSLRDGDLPAIVLRNRAGRRWLGRVSARLGLTVPVRWTDRFETAVRVGNVLLSEIRARRTGGWAIMDRHLVCQWVLRRVRGLPEGRVLPRMARAMLDAHIVVVLDVPVETAYHRIRARGEDLESLEYLRATRAVYLELARIHGWAVVDATATTGAVVGRITDITGHD